MVSAASSATPGTRRTGQHQRIGRAADHALPKSVVAAKLPARLTVSEDPAGALSPSVSVPNRTRLVRAIAAATASATTASGPSSSIWNTRGLAAVSTSASARRVCTTRQQVGVRQRRRWHVGNSLVPADQLVVELREPCRNVK